MESKKLQLCFPNLPEDIIDFQVLPRLPVKSLLRFKSVSKRWCSWISDPRFRFSNARRRLLVGPLMDIKFTQDSYLETIDDDEGVSVKKILQPWGERELPLSREPQLFRLLGSCNGFVLVSLGTSIFLWNPATKDSEKVLTHEVLAFRGKGSLYIMHGLSYDSSTEDYKVIIGYRSVEFSNLRRGKCCWKEVGFPYILPRSNTGPVVSGNQHWLVEGRKQWDSFSSIVVYFDAGIEKFVEMPIPNLLSPDKSNNDNIIFGMGELDGCLALAQWDHVSHLIHVRVMKEYNVQESWTTLFKCSNFMNLDCPPVLESMELLCITKGGEFVMMGNETDLEAYCPKIEFNRRIKTYRHCVIIADYKESLVSPRAAIINKSEQHLKKDPQTIFIGGSQ
ncbi:hypothetical protein LguiA_014300 [Lonicera macranthoides]